MTLLHLLSEIQRQEGGELGLTVDGKDQLICKGLPLELVQTIRANRQIIVDYMKGRQLWRGQPDDIALRRTLEGYLRTELKEGPRLVVDMQTNQTVPADKYLEGVELKGRVN